MVVCSQTAVNVDIKILYFPFGGRGTALRLAAFIGNLRFEDEFISFEEFKSIRQNYTIKWCTLPQIIVYDNNHNEISIIGQSNTCLRYIGWKCNLYPLNPIHARNCDEIMDFIEDMMLLLAPSEFCGDDNKKRQLRQELSKNELLIWLQKLEWRLKENIDAGYKNGYIIGNNITIADCKLYCFIRHFGKCKWREGYYKYIDENILETFPLLKTYKTYMASKQIIKQFDKRWRERHKGFKSKNNKYPKCFVWNQRNTKQNCIVNDKEEVFNNTNKNHNRDQSYKQYIQFIILSAVLFFILIISKEIWVPIFGLLIFFGISDSKSKKQPFKFMFDNDCRLN